MFSVGDTVQVKTKVREGEKERLVAFQGVVIAMKGKGISRTFMVRKIAKGGVGVERIFPLHSPLIAEVKVIKKGKVRRSKLYYLRQRKGKAAMQVKLRSTGAVS
ncbi:50S ribosomal protein L19 [candidate division CPR3 bacterium 4484_211]|uniref:50S ribosomal protein L19 n=1 Tax=candidate division CPR3 bacterium 4484_211 TaxID=1968527 RepID=A0A1W9NYS4_UNCC3|nr:MAG: 50S ribosomal protein L19 [candidate division CPR3 bacterium 4484_211]